MSEGGNKDIQSHTGGDILGLQSEHHGFYMNSSHGFSREDTKQERQTSSSSCISSNPAGKLDNLPSRLSTNELVFEIQLTAKVRMRKRARSVGCSIACPDTIESQICENHNQIKMQERSTSRNAL